jgi:hypothetical protein
MANGLWKTDNDALGMTDMTLAIQRTKRLRNGDDEGDPIPGRRRDRWCIQCGPR